MGSNRQRGSEEIEDLISRLRHDPAFDRYPTAELRLQLARDPVFVDRQRAVHKVQEANRQRYLAAAAPVLAELRSHGLSIDNQITELRSASSNAYAVAVPLLARWLPRIDDPDVKEDIVRTLSVPRARAAIPILIDEFRQTDGAAFPGLHWAIGNALEVLADSSNADQLLGLALDPKYGRARQMVVLGLGKLKHSEVVDTLINLLNDPDVSGHAVKALRKQADPRSRQALEPFTTHPMTWIRNEAKKAIAKIDCKSGLS